MRPQQIWNVVHVVLLGVTLLLCVCFGVALVNPLNVVGTQVPPTLAQVLSPTPGLPPPTLEAINTTLLPVTVTLSASATSTSTSTPTPSITDIGTATSTVTALVTHTATSTLTAPTHTPLPGGYPGDQTPPAETQPPGSYP
jgi:hypothetical protein